MKAVFLKLVILSLLVLAFGCSSLQKLTQDEIGQPISTIANRLGPPTRVSSDGKGGNVFVWEQWVPSGYGTGYVWSSTFWADSNGIIYKWK